MPVLRLPAPLRSLADGAATVELPGGTVRQLLDAADRAHPGLAARVLDGDGELHRFVNVFVGERDVRDAAGLDTSVAPGDTVTVVPAVAGGADDGAVASGDEGGAVRGDEGAGVGGGDRRRPAVDSWLAHGGVAPDPRTGAVVPGIPVSTTFARSEEYALPSEAHEYVRDHDDAVRRVETVVARLEGAAATLAFASGMATILAVVRSVPAGGTVLLQSGIYWGATAAIRRLAPHHGLTLVEVDCTDTAAATAAIDEHRPGLVLVEALSNPLLGVVDVAALADAVHGVDGVLAVDATVPTPLSVQPLALGADLSISSATKSMNGHSDVLAGVVSTADVDSRTWAFLAAERHDAGAVLGPFGAFLLHRGLRTFGLRHDRACASAQRLAEHLVASPVVDRVLYPGLPGHPGHDLAVAQCRRGFGSLLSVVLDGGAEAALRVAGALELCVTATSLGGVETLVEHRATVERGVTDVPPGLLRVSVGIEHPQDLLDDWTGALAAA